MVLTGALVLESFEAEVSVVAGADSGWDGGVCVVVVSITGGVTVGACV